MLSEAQRTSLLRIARDAIVLLLTNAGVPHEAEVGTLPDAGGLFVTIKRGGALRGCLGTLECREDLAREVARYARNSATGDPRFPPVTAEELPELSLEISILGPLEEIDPLRPGSIAVGRHGLVVELGERRGLLLPQVAIEWNWTHEQFLRQTSRKAGLPDDAWRSGARVYRFEAEVFGE